MKSLILIAFLIISVIIKAQHTKQDSILNQIFVENRIISGTNKSASSTSKDTPTPKLYDQTFNFNKVQESEISGYYGKPQISIPLYEIKFDDIKIPINIYYNASGIKVDQFSDIVGLGWTLNSGGEITKLVNNIEDNSELYYWTPTYGVGHVKYGYAHGSSAYILPRRDAPDIYKINFSGLEGSFIIKNNLVPEFVSKNNYYKIDFERGLDDENEVKKYGFYSLYGNSCGASNVPMYLMAYYTHTNCQWTVYRETDTQKITISKDKYKYYFNEWEQNFSGLTQRYQNVSSGSSDSYHKSYKISKIINQTNNNSVDFEYETYAGINNYSKQDIQEGFITPFQYDSTTPGSEPATLSIGKSDVFINKLLKKITTKNEIIEFYYSYEREDNEFTDVEFAKPSHLKTKKYPLLKKIEIKNKSNALLYTYVFNYNYFNSNCTEVLCKRLKLVGIDKIFPGDTNQEIQKYTFDYYTDNNLPKVSSFNYDAFGFAGNFTNDNNLYPGSIEPNSQINIYRYGEALPNITQPVYYYSSLNIPSLNPTKVKTGVELGISNLQKMRSWSLKSITYPTKGREEFIYEPHQFLWKNVPITGGGIRIKAINLIDNSIAQTTSYEYGNGETHTIPYHNAREIKHSNNTGGVYEFLSHFAVPKMDDESIFYKQFTIVKPNKSKIVTQYLSTDEYPEQIPDINVLNNFSFPYINITLKKYLLNDIFAFSYLNAKNFRGKPKNIDYFDSNAKLIKKETFQYAAITYPDIYSGDVFDLGIKNFHRDREDPPSEGDYRVVGGLSFADGPLLKKIFMPYSMKVSKRIEKNYNILNSNYVENKSEYTYDSFNNVSSEIRTSSDNKIYTTQYSYATDKGNQKLIDANMVGIPLETTMTKKESFSAVEKLISKSETKYATTHLLPTSALSYDLQNTSVASTEVTYDQYDSKGNIQQYTTKAGVPTTIIWGYNQTQPIAKIVGAKLSDVPQSQITAIVNASNEDASDPAKENLLMTALDTFRKNTSLASYQVSTYTYDPLIGVTSITPPSGIREVYIYDTANRLKEIRQQEVDSSGNITYKTVKEFKYNYKN